MASKKIYGMVFIARRAINIIILHNNMNKDFEFIKWFYYLDKDICYKTNIIKIKPIVTKFILYNNKIILNLLYKIFREKQKDKTNIHYFLHLIDQKYYSLNIDTYRDFISFVNKKNNIELFKKSMTNDETLYLIQQEYFNENINQIEKYEITIWSKKTRSINLISSENSKKRTIEIYKYIKEFIKEFLYKNVISNLPYKNYNVILHCCFNNDYIIKCLIYNICIPNISGSTNSFFIVPTKRLHEYKGPNKYIKI